MQVHVEREDTDHQQQGHFHEQIAEAPDATLEVGLGRAQLQAIGNRPELGVPPDRGHHRRGSTGHHVGAQKDRVGPLAQGCPDRQDRDRLLGREGLAGQGGFVREEIPRLEEEAVARSGGAGREEDHVTRHHLGQRHTLRGASP